MTIYSLLSSSAIIIDTGYCTKDAERGNQHGAGTNSSLQALHQLDLHLFPRKTRMDSRNMCAGRGTRQSFLLSECLRSAVPPKFVIGKMLEYISKFWQSCAEMVPFQTMLVCCPGISITLSMGECRSEGFVFPCRREKVDWWWRVWWDETIGREVQGLGCVSFRVG